MSALGQKRTFAPQNVVSALPPRADICSAKCNVCFGPRADIKPWPLVRWPGRRGAMTTAHTQQQTIASQDRVLVGTLKLVQWRAIMMVTITTFNLAQPTTLDEITKTFQVTAPKYQGVAGLLSKNYWMSEDGRRVGGIYVWETRADADRLYTAEWKKFVEGKYGTAPQIEYLHSPVMVDNRDGSIKVAA